MALDRFVHFGKRKPKKADVESVLRNFFGDGAQKIEWNGDRFTILLHGAETFPFADLEPDLTPRLRRDERWIEVCPGNPLDVITRLGDEYTNVLAAGIAEMFARYWEGEVDPCD